MAQVKVQQWHRGLEMSTQPTNQLRLGSHTAKPFTFSDCSFFTPKLKGGWTKNMVAKTLPILKFYDAVKYKRPISKVFMSRFTNFFLEMKTEKLVAKSLSKLAMW